MESIIQVKNLSLQFPLRYGTVQALRKVSMDIPQHMVTALVGESGSGKTTLATALMKLVSYPGEITEGEILYQGRDVIKMTPKELSEGLGGIKIIFNQSEGEAFINALTSE